MDRNEKKRLLRCLAALATERVPAPSNYEVDSGHEMSGFIHFKSEEEVQDLDAGLRRPIRKEVADTALPKSPDIPEEEFLRIQRRVTRKTGEETLREYYAHANARHEMPEEVLEATAEYLSSDDEWEEVSDSNQSLNEEVAARHEDSDDGGRRSRIDFVPIVDDGDSSEGTSAMFNTQLTAGFTIRSRFRSSARLHVDHEMSCKSDNVWASSYQQLDDEHENSILSGFHPKSCSTSIGHESLDQSRVMDFGDPEFPSDNAECPADQTIVPRTDSPDLTSSTSPVERFAASRETRPSETRGFAEPSQSTLPDGELSLDRTPSTMMKQCNLGPDPSKSCPESRNRETPIARRLRRLGLFDSHCTSNLHTPKRRKLATARRFLQVYGTPRRESDSLGGFFHPTVDLAELVKFRVVERDPFKINFSLQPTRFVD